MKRFMYYIITWILVIGVRAILILFILVFFVVFCFFLVII